MLKCLKKQTVRINGTYRVLHIIPAYGGGISTYVKNLIAAQNHDNVIMDVTGFGHIPTIFSNVVENNGGRVYELPNVYKSPIKFISIYCKTLKNDYDAVHCHLSGYKGWIFKILARIAGVKIIITHAHRTDDEKKSFYYYLSVKISQRLSQSCSDCYMTCSKMAANFIFGEKFVEKHSIWMMPNTIEPTEYKQELTKIEQETYLNELGLENKPEIIIGHIGRFNKQKNHHFLIEIAKILKKNKFNFSMILIGNGTDLEKIKERVQLENLQDVVFFFGNRNDVNRLLKFMDVMVLPSLFEGLPTVAIESQAAGTPCILADTITKETDLGMGLVEFVSITDGVELWYKAIKKILTIKKSMQYDQRVKLLKKQGYIDFVMRKKYVNTLCQYEKNKCGYSNIQFKKISE